MQARVQLASRCSNCHYLTETMQHVLFHYSRAMEVWRWLSSKVEANLVTDSLESVLNIMLCRWDNDIRQMVICVVIHCVWHIWLIRNDNKYNGRNSSTQALLASISRSISLSSNLMDCKTRFWNDRRLLVKFNIRLTFVPHKIPKQVMWYPPLEGFIKCNSDRGSLGCPGHSITRSIFRDSKGNFLGAYASYVGIHSTLEAELMSVMITMDYVQ
ncbi:hypothetical protein Fmac_015433 [Flemingia macrophylla]|uniref:Uncharacterized protein n=1 Tax=Flemingia macrophylla TaxID=520843 RepID=A0ABD1MGN1_9FABA